MAQEYEQPWNVSISVPKGRKLVVGCGFYRNWNDYERSNRNLDCSTSRRRRDW
jgi:hypothetical protein